EVEDAALAGLLGHEYLDAAHGNRIVRETGTEIVVDGAVDLEAEAFATPWADRRAILNEDARTHATTSYVLYGIGGAAVLTSALLFALDTPTRVETYRPPLAVDVAPDGVKLRATW
ncbi:MAG TPA: hypothetical protein PK095_25015, partial [Myxococcota bacterium]|nr:hypothetical protein [Myxococcota bacterium]